MTAEAFPFADDLAPVRVLQPRTAPTGHPVMGSVASAAFGFVSGLAVIACVVAGAWVLGRVARRWLL